MTSTESDVTMVVKEPSDPRDAVLHAVSGALQSMEAGDSLTVKCHPQEVGKARYTVTVRSVNDDRTDTGWQHSLTESLKNTRGLSPGS